MGQQVASADAFTTEQTWHRDDISVSQPWAKTVPTACLDIVTDRIARWHREGRKPSVIDVTLDDAGRAAGRDALAHVQREIDSGCGFVVLDRLPVERWSPEDATLAYALIGRMLGTPVSQSKDGKRLYDVVDTGADVTKGARFSVTNAPSSFHTDGTFNPAIADYVGLLCLRTAKSGGESQMASACTVHQAIRAMSSELFDALYAPFWFDRRGQHADDELPGTAHPVFVWDGRELTMRYLRYYIDEGHRTMDQPLTVTQRDALDAVDQCLADERFFVEFKLEPGQMLLSNNHWLLHSRSGYEDHADPAKRRHYVRLWLNRDGEG